MKSQFKRAITLIRTKEKYLPLLKDKWKYLIALLLIVFTKEAFPILGYVISFLTFLILIHDTLEVIRFVRAIDLIENDNDKNSFPFSSEPRKQRNDQQAIGSPKLLNLGSLRQGHDEQEYSFEKVWLDEDLNRHLWASSGVIKVGVDKKKYQLPPDLAEIAAPVIAQAGRKAQGGRSRAAYLFNGARARLMVEPSDLMLDPHKEFLFQRAMYFDLLSSNHLWHYSRDISIPEGGFRLPLQHTVDFERRLLRLDESRLANTVGISCLVITRDGWLIFVVQSERNAIHPSAIAPSGSGSLDWSDVLQEVASQSKNETGKASLKNLLFRGMLRELEEETAASVSAVPQTSHVVTSYFRWLSRGAKPEFTGLAKSDQSWDDICQRSIQIDETIYTKSRLRVPLSFLLEAVNKDDLEEAAEIRRLRDKLVEIASSHVSSHEAGMSLGSISVSTGVAWLAAIEFLKENPSYLNDFQY